MSWRISNAIFGTMIKTWIVILIINKSEKCLIGYLTLWWSNEAKGKSTGGWTQQRLASCSDVQCKETSPGNLHLTMPPFHLQGLYSMGGENWIVTKEHLGTGMKAAEITSVHITLAKTGQWLQLKRKRGWDMVAGSTDVPWALNISATKSLMAFV